MRGLAVVAVVGYHLGFSWLQGGFLGVSLFFTLSGFLITNLLLAESNATGGVSLRTFWARRARRLLPAAFAGILLAIVAVAVVGTADQLRALPGDVLGATFYVANWRFVLNHSAYAPGYQAPRRSCTTGRWPSRSRPTSSCPSSSCCSPGAADRVRSPRSGPARRRPLLAAVLALMAASAVATLILGAAADPNRVYYGTDTRGFELLAGVLLALIVGFPAVGGAVAGRGRRLVSGAGVAILGLIVALWVTVPETSRWLYRGGLWGVSALSCALILAAFGGGWFAKALGSRVLSTLGRMSYGIYVYHWPLIILLQPGTAGLHGLGLAGVRVGATAVAATASYHWLELPIRQQRWKLPRITWRLAPLVPAVAVLAAFVVSGQAASRSVASLHDEPIVLQEAPPSAAAAGRRIAPGAVHGRFTRPGGLPHLRRPPRGRGGVDPRPRGRRPVADVAPGGVAGPAQARDRHVRSRRRRARVVLRQLQVRPRMGRGRTAGPCPPTPRRSGRSGGAWPPRPA